MTGEHSRPHDRTDGELVLAVRGQDQEAFTELFDRWFDRVFSVARNIVRDDETAAEVAQDTFLAVWQKMDSLNDPDAFGGWALRIGRNRALNRLKKEQRSRPMEAEIMTGLHDRGAGDDHLGSDRLTDTVEISEARDRQDLIWAVSSVLGERDASLMDLTLRHHLTTSEIALELGMTENNAHQLLFRLRKKLGEAVANYLIWRNGNPRCSELLALVRPAGSSAPGPFDAPLSRKVKRHSKNCETCSNERAAAISPQRLFASIPVAAAPLALRAKAASGLAQSGVPVAATPNHDSSAGRDSGAGSDSGAGNEQPPIQSPGHGLVQAREPKPAPELAAAAASSPPKGMTWRKKVPLFVAAAVALTIGILLLADSPTTEVSSVPAGSPTTETIITDTTSVSTPESQSDKSTPESAPTIEVAPTTVTFEPPAESAPTSATTRPPPSATTSQTAAPEVTAANPPPVIVRFSIGDPVAVTLACVTPGEIGRRAVWLTENADSVQVVTPTETFTHGPTGDQLFCAAPGSTVGLIVTGPGGTATSTATA